MIAKSLLLYIKLNHAAELTLLLQKKVAKMRS